MYTKPYPLEQAELRLRRSPLRVLSLADGAMGYVQRNVLMGLRIYR